MLDRNILVISQMFPCKRHPTSAIFFFNLMKELAPAVNKLIVITPRPYFPKILSRIKPDLQKWYIDPLVSRNGRIEIIRPRVPALRGIAYLGVNALLMQYSLSLLLKYLIGTRGIDMVLGYNMLPEGIAAVRLAKKFQLPAGFWCIGSDVNDFARFNSINYQLVKKSVELSDIILTESKDLERTVREYSDKQLNIQTFYKGIDVSNFQDLFPKPFLLKKLGLAEGKRYLLFVGRLIHDKGIHELCEAFTDIALRYPDVDLILVGEEVEKEALSAKLSMYGILHRVHFKGIRPYNEIAYFMKISDLLVLPTWAEGLPNVVMEAMASGLPVVASDVGGIPEILENEVTGLSIPAKNVGMLTNAVIRMLEDRILRDTCVRNAKNLIHNQFDVKKNAVQLCRILEELKRSADESRRFPVGRTE